MVLSHFHDPPKDKVQEVNINEVREQYKDYDPRIKVSAKGGHCPLETDLCCSPCLAPASETFPRGVRVWLIVGSVSSTKFNRPSHAGRY